MRWAPQQSAALDAVRAWLANPAGRPVFRLFGYAGTGKTTLARHLADNESGRVCFAAFTGKAAKVMRDKGCRGASTIHSLIYDAERDETTGIFRYHLKRDQDADINRAALVIVDECSMVGEKLGADLLSFKKPVLVLGDPAQLPAIDGGGYFTETAPDFMLDEVHRQAAESPIIRIATDIREARFDRQPAEFDGARILRKGDMNSEIVLAADKVLIGTNRTRFSYNRRLRELLGFSGDRPNVGETLICLRNDHSLGLLNGAIWDVAKVKRDRKTDAGRVFAFDLRDTDNPDRHVPARVYEHFFRGDAASLDWQAKRGTQEFDYGYAITVHKSQGSQWDSVCVFDEGGVFGPDRNRWLYTAVTRAAERLTLAI